MLIGQGALANDPTAPTTTFREPKASEEAPMLVERSDTKTYLFADGIKRSFKTEMIDARSLIVPADPPKDEDAERLARGKIAGGVATPKAINLELEKQIQAQPDDPAPYLVYADWLQHRDDPRGLLIPVQADLQRQPSSRKLRDAERKLLEEHGEYLLPPELHRLLRLPRRSRPDDPKARCDAAWKFGFLESVHLAKRPKQTGGEIETVIEPLLRHPSAHFLRKLSIGGLGTTDEYNFIACIAAIARAKHPLLRELVIGDFARSMMELDFSRVGSASVLFGAQQEQTPLPALEHLTLRAGTIRFDANLKHPKLRSLRIVTRDMAASNLQRVWSSQLPELESFELSCLGLEVDAGVVLRLLKNHPKLRRITLYNTQKTAAFLEALAVSEGIRQLTHLELLDTDIADHQVAGIEKQAKRLAHLEALILGGTRITKRGALRLSKISKGVRVSAGPDRRDIAITDVDVVKRAPDANSVPAARAIAKPEKWLRIARDGNRVWGEFESKNDHYYVLAHLEDTAQMSCGCGSIKDPCKHALALLFMASAQHDFELAKVPDGVGRQTRDRPEYGWWWNRDERSAIEQEDDEA